MNQQRISSLLDYHNRIQTDSRSSVIGNLSIFRGQRDINWQILPTIVRPPAFSQQTSLAKSMLDANDLSDERRLLIMFRDLAVSFLPEWTYSGSEQEILWKQILLAQHYRLPTRLVDWTTNPLVALYFAVEGKPEKCTKDCTHSADYSNSENSHHSVVYILRSRDSFSVNSLARNNPNPPIYRGRNDPGIIRPPSIDKRFIAQNGVFTIGVDPGRPINEDERIIVDADSRENILQELDVYGINKRSMFPDLEHLGEYLQWSVHKWNPPRTVL